mmetsp:Transcript_33048/g.63146  ORF Transcript_33048/g.63146 Transcript_33048/m.63146 type:complete len:313 (-) Transcript_33048:522-1460(-)
MPFHLSQPKNTVKLFITSPYILFCSSHHTSRLLFLLLLLHPNPSKQLVLPLHQRHAVLVEHLVMRLALLVEPVEVESSLLQCLDQRRFGIFDLEGDCAMHAGIALSAGASRFRRAAGSSSGCWRCADGGGFGCIGLGEGGGRSADVSLCFWTGGSGSRCPFRFSGLGSLGLGTLFRAFGCIFHDLIRRFRMSRRRTRNRSRNSQCIHPLHILPIRKPLRIIQSIPPTQFRGEPLRRKSIPRHTLQYVLLRSEMDGNIILNPRGRQHLDQREVLIVGGTGMANVESPPWQGHDASDDGRPLGDDIAIDLFGGA